MIMPKKMTENEKTKTWYGSIGLLNSSDFIKESTNPGCITKTASRTDAEPCSYNNGNYFDSNMIEYWVLDRNSATEITHSTSQHNTAGAFKKGWLSGYYSISEYPVKPVVFLNKDIKFKNNGSKEDPFEIQ